MAVIKADKQFKISSIEKVKNIKNVSIRKVKNRFNGGKQSSTKPFFASSGGGQPKK